MTLSRLIILSVADSSEMIWSLSGFFTWRLKLGNDFVGYWFS